MLVSNHMLEVQKMASTVLSVIGAISTNLYFDNDESFDLESLLKYLNDTGKILSAIVHKQTNTRKAFIEPGLTKETRAILKDTKVDDFLFEKELSEKIKEARALNKIGENLKIQAPNKGPATKKHLNERPPFVRRPIRRQMGSIPFRGRLKQTVFSRNNQQFVNHRAQLPLQSRPSNRPETQEKKN